MVGRTREALAKIFVTAQSRLATMADKSKPENSEFLPFEGMWLVSPDGAVACAKIINGKLLIPYSHGNEGKLTGHYYDCHLIGNKLVSRFQRFDSNVGGFLVLAIGPNRTLQGGWWVDKDIPQAVREDISNLSDSLPRMVRSVWVFMPKEKTHPWAEKYFQADPPWAAL